MYFGVLFSGVIDNPMYPLSTNIWISDPPRESFACVMVKAVTSRSNVHDQFDFTGNEDICEDSYK